MDSVDEFYRSCARVTALDINDDLVLAYVEGDLSGVVRLCSEHGTHTLRTMQIKLELQGLGLGRLILERFVDLIKEKQIKTVYCMPYEHLEYFYGLIGFRKIENSSAPEFLRNRAQEYHARHADKNVVLMKREQ